MTNTWSLKNWRGEQWDAAKKAFGAGQLDGLGVELVISWGMDSRGKNPSHTAKVHRSASGHERRKKFKG